MKWLEAKGKYETFYVKFIISVIKEITFYLIFKATLEIIDYKAPKREVKEVSMHGRLSTLDH